MALFLTGLTGLQTRSQRLLFAHVGCSNRHALIQTHRLNPQPTALLWFRLNLISVRNGTPVIAACL